MPNPWSAPRALSPVSGRVEVPGSKSATNRALVLAALADSPSLVDGALQARDTDLMVAALAALGTGFDRDGSRLTVTPGPLHGPAAVDCGLAGTVMRFVPAVAALADGPVSFDGDARARERPMGPVIEAMRQLGVVIDGDDSLPFTVRGTGSVRGGTVALDASASSQFVSALLLAGARYDSGVVIRHRGAPIPSMPHIAMSVEMLRERGVDVTVDASDPAAASWTVAPGTIAGMPTVIEPDLSNAAPFLAAAAVTGGQVTVPRWPRSTTQAGDALRGLLSDMGCEVRLDDGGLTVTGPPPGSLSGLDVDLHDVGELTPVIAALAALASSPSCLRGIAHLRGHETDRLAALETELRAVGSDARQTDDGLLIVPSSLHGAQWHAYDDHRMATAGAVIGLVVDGITVDDIATTAKTLPGFDRMWAALVAADGLG